MVEKQKMTTVYFIRHAEPDYNNHDDMSRELSNKGLQDRKLVQGFYWTSILILYYPVLINGQLIQLLVLQNLRYALLAQFQKENIFIINY